MRVRDEQDIIILEQDSSAMKWLVVGAALGAGFALMLAPASGEETRRRLTRQAKKLREMAEDAIDEVQEQYESFRDSLTGEDEEAGEEDEATAELEDEDLEEDTEAEAAEAEDDRIGEPLFRRPRKVTPAREELERRLAAVRARRRVPDLEDEEPVA